MMMMMFSITGWKLVVCMRLAYRVGCRLLFHTDTEITLKLTLCGLAGQKTHQEGLGSAD